MGVFGSQAGVSSCRWLLLSCVVVAVALTAPAAAEGGCAKGDAPCFCSQIGGTWRALQAPLLPACKVTYQHQGAERYVHVYLPPSYDGSTQWPIWVHLHGVFWATMGDIGARVGQPVNGTDIIPAFDHSVEILGDKAILVYPQSTGEAGNGTPDEGQGAKYRQFWRIPFWRCSVGICRDPSIDDMGFIEKVVADLPKRLPLKPGHYLLSGESAGGMMVHAILCQSKSIPKMVDAAIDMLGGIGADYARGPECAASGATPIPFLKLHGVDDPFITYSKDILVDGVNFASSIEGTQMRAKGNGCGPDDVGPKDVSEGDGKMLCTDYCGGAKAGKPPAKLCGMPGVGHSTDYPHPGFVYQQSWQWFEQQVKASAERRLSGALKKLSEKDARVASKATAAAAAVKKNATVLPKVALPKSKSPEPLTLNITYPGASLDDFKGPKAGAALSAVANLTDLPAENITATYTLAAPADRDASTSSGDNGSRRLLHKLLLRRRLAAAAASGVTGSYTLRTSQPSAVADAVISSVQDGSLLQSLQQKGLAGADGNAGPLVSLSASSAAGAAGGQSQQQTVLLQPVDLAELAARAADPASGTTAAAGGAGAGSAVGSASDAAAASAATPKHAAGGVSISDTTTASRSSGGGGSSQASTGVVVGAVVGSLVGAALLAGGAFWAVRHHRQQRQEVEKLQELQQQADAYSQEWEQKQQQKQQQHEGPRVINLSADAVMCIAAEDSMHGGSKV